MKATESPIPSELEMAREMVIGQLAWVGATLSKRLKITSVQQFCDAYDEFQKDSLLASYEAMKTQDGALARLDRVNEFWEASVDFLLSGKGKELPELEFARVAFGVRTLGLTRHSLMGCLLMFKFPKLRERILKTDQKRSAEGETPTISAP